MRTPPGRRSQRTIGLAISLVSVILLLGSVEIAGYLWERRTAQEALGWTLVASRRMPLVPRGVEEAPYYVLEPNRDYDWEGIPVSISRQGFRNEEFSPDKPSKTFRILNLGDSVVFGWEVFQEETYGKRLEQLLNDHDDRFVYEVINAGVPGWNLPMELEFLAQEGLGYEPDVVLLEITLVNDVYGKGPMADKKHDIFDWLRDNTYAWPFLTTQARFLLARGRGPETIPVLNPPLDESEYYPLDGSDPAWEQVRDTVLKMQQPVQAHGGRFILIVFPTAFQLNSAAHSDFPQRLIQDTATAAGIEVVDMLPIYRRACEAADDGACEGYENLLFADVWMHPNAYGHQLAAEALFEVLQQQ